MNRCSRSKVCPRKRSPKPCRGRRAARVPETLLPPRSARRAPATTWTNQRVRVPLPFVEFRRLQRRWPDRSRRRAITGLDGFAQLQHFERDGRARGPARCMCRGVGPHTSPLQLVCAAGALRVEMTDD